MSDRYTPLSPEQMAKRLCSLQAPMVVMHRHPDGDTVGSATALIRLFEAMGIHAVGLCADKIPERLSFLTKGLSIYTALPQGKFDVVAVDVASPDQLGSLKDVLTGDFAPCLMIDHHAIGTPFADHLTQPKAAAAGEVVYDVAVQMQKIHPKAILPDMAQRCLYAALSSDTGCFRYSNVTPKTLRTAAALLENPAVDAADINHSLFEAKSERQLRAEAFAIEHTCADEDGTLAWVTLTQADRTALDVEDEHLETVIDMVRSRAGVEIALAVRENADGSFKASMRSSGFDVAAIAALFGGGGHVRAAGCTLYAPNIQEAAQTVLDAIRSRRQTT